MEPISFTLSALPPEAVQAVTAYIQNPPQAPYSPMDGLIETLSAIPQTAALYQAQGLPDAVLADTLSDIAIWAKAHHKQTGRWGVPATDWLALHTAGKLFRVGRIQCIPRTMQWDVAVYQNRRTGQVTAFPSKPVTYRHDGQVSGTNGIFEDGFQSVFRVTDHYIEGTPLSPYGHAVSQTLRLLKDEHELVLATGMPALELHVPEGPGFTPEACKASLQAIQAFARTHADCLMRLIPDAVEAPPEGQPFAALYIASWLMDAQLGRLLPKESNIAAFLREFYLIPVLSDSRAAMSRVFGDDYFDPLTLDESQLHSNLQRAITAFMRQGGLMRYNMGFILPPHLTQYGQSPYRKMHNEKEAATCHN